MTEENKGAVATPEESKVVPSAEQNITSQKPEQKADVNKSDTPVVETGKNPDDVEQLGNVKKRIDKYVAQAKAAEERSRLNEQLAANYAAELQKLKGVQTSDLPEPNKNAYVDAHDYAKALVKWQEDKQNHAAEAQKKILAEVQVNNYREILNAGHKARVEEIVKVLPDYDSVVKQLDQGLLSLPQILAIQSSPLSAEIAYHLGKNPDLIAELRSMNQLESAMRIGRLEAELQSVKAKTNPTQPMGVLPESGAPVGKNPSVTPGNRIADLRKKLSKRRA